ncbi:gamma-interferon-responsive lysosomal thiol protein [Mercurialis annua]|uniref:gamma-interferon-responsive lysosomal thiol protein n=1 Tax=Mercurialis annua TaxID=3986 RepID=UPI00215F3FA7|nr:gamma-interferon-responsive lysosomal thiol protein [Mercurialis annua]
MASSSSSSSQKFLLCLCLIIISFSLASSSDTNSAKKVKVDFYYESLCPYCSRFMVNYVAKKLIEDKDLFSIVDLHLSPWGNTKFKSNDTFVCQHGPSECLLDTVEACAIHLWPRFEEHFGFIHCVESLVVEHKYTEWESCFAKLGLAAEPILDCYASGLGKELELQYAAETNALQPPHQYVPWVVVDGKPLYEDYENFVSYICKAYKSTSNSAPKACSEVTLYTSQRGKAMSIAPVSYKDKKMSTLSGRIISALSLWMQRMNGAASA